MQTVSRTRSRIPRVTYDLDLCYARSKQYVARLPGALTELHATLRGVTEGLPCKLHASTIEMDGNFTLATDIVDLDTHAWAEPLGDTDG
jgi:hypothetical protein